MFIKHWHSLETGKNGYLCFLFFLTKLPSSYRKLQMILLKAYNAHIFYH